MVAWWRNQGKKGWEQHFSENVPHVNYGPRESNFFHIVFKLEKSLRKTERKTKQNQKPPF